jgi:hypothetical protein
MKAPIPPKNKFNARPVAGRPGAERCKCGKCPECLSVAQERERFPRSKKPLDIESQAHRVVNTLIGEAEDDADYAPGRSAMPGRPHFDPELEIDIDPVPGDDDISEERTELQIAEDILAAVEACEGMEDGKCDLSVIRDLAQELHDMHSAEGDDMLGDTDASDPDKLDDDFSPPPEE